MAFCKQSQLFYLCCPHLVNVSFTICVQYVSDVCQYWLSYCVPPGRVLAIPYWSLCATVGPGAVARLGHGLEKGWGVKCYQR